jgi:hypothetical protein
MPASSRLIEGKKFMWDGVVYKSEEEAREVEEKYKKDGFQVGYIEEDNQYLLYTRRVVTQIVVEDKPPA